MNKPSLEKVSAAVPGCPQLSPTGQDRRGQEKKAISPSYFSSLPSTLRERRATNRLRDLEDAMVADAELIHDCRWRVAAARERIADGRAEIDRLRAELGVTP